MEIQGTESWSSQSTQHVNETPKNEIQISWVLPCPLNSAAYPWDGSYMQGHVKKKGEGVLNKLWKHSRNISTFFPQKISVCQHFLSITNKE